jgi:nitrogen regulatory protein PII 1
MKMIKAVIRPEKEYDVVSGLEKAGFYSLTKVDVLGRGRQRGIQVGNTTYDELSKLMLMLVVEDKEANRVIELIQQHARTGNFGDGKIFVTDVAQTYTIRTGQKQ